MLPSVLQHLKAITTSNILLVIRLRLAINRELLCHHGQRLRRIPILVFPPQTGLERRRRVEIDPQRQQIPKQIACGQDQVDVPPPLIRLQVKYQQSIYPRVHQPDRP
jgi:hypothetical protein